MTTPAEPPPGQGPEAPPEPAPHEGDLASDPPGVAALAPTVAQAESLQGDAELGIVRARRRDKILGLAIVAVTFLLGLGVSVWAKHASRPETSEPPGPPTTAGIVGFPYRVDVVATLNAARQVTKRTLLRGIVLDGVRSDGTIDLTEGPGRARYVFQSPPGRGPQPADAGPPAFRHVYCGRQEVQLRHEGLVAAADQAALACPPDSLEPLPDPQCSLAKIWQHALKKGIRGDRLAHIEYYRANEGPAWRFDLREGGKRFVLYGDCRRELRGTSASGHVP